MSGVNTDLLVSVLKRAAQRGAQHRGVDRDQAAVAAGWLVVDGHLLVIVLGEQGEQLERATGAGLTPGARLEQRGRAR